MYVKCDLSFKWAPGVDMSCILFCAMCFPLLAPSPDDTIGDLKKLVAAQTGTKWEKIVLKKW